MSESFTEKDFLDVKDDLKDGRVSPGGAKYGIAVFGVLSVFFIGVAYLVGISNSSIIGWENLPVFWQGLFKLQVFLFSLQIFIIIFISGKSNWTQMLLNVSFVVYTYKMAIDPFMTLSMLTMDRDVYELYRPFIFGIIVLGFIFHFYLIYRYFEDIKKEKQCKMKRRKESHLKEKDITDPKETVKKKKRKWPGGFYLVGCIPIFYILNSITRDIVRSNLLGEGEIIFGIAIFTFLFIALLIGSVDFVIAAYCVIRYPSFRVNPPVVIRQQRKRKKRRRKGRKGK